MIDPKELEQDFDAAVANLAKIAADRRMQKQAGIGTKIKGLADKYFRKSTPADHSWPDSYSRFMDGPKELQTRSIVNDLGTRIADRYAPMGPDVRNISFRDPVTGKSMSQSAEVIPGLPRFADVRSVQNAGFRASESAPYTQAMTGFTLPGTATRKLDKPKLTRDALTAGVLGTGLAVPATWGVDNLWNGKTLTGADRPGSPPPSNATPAAPPTAPKAAPAIVKSEPKAAPKVEPKVEPKAAPGITDQLKGYGNQALDFAKANAGPLAIGGGALLGGGLLYDQLRRRKKRTKEAGQVEDAIAVIKSRADHAVNAMKEYGSQGMDFFNKQDLPTQTAIGAGLGGLGGGLYGYLSGDRKRKSQGTLSGLLSGAALGGFAGAAPGLINQLKAPSAVSPEDLKAQASAKHRNATISGEKSLPESLRDSVTRFAKNPTDLGQAAGDAGATTLGHPGAVVGTGLGLLSGAAANRNDRADLSNQEVIKAHDAKVKDFEAAASKQGPPPNPKTPQSGILDRYGKPMKSMLDQTQRLADVHTKAGPEVPVMPKLMNVAEPHQIGKQLNNLMKRPTPEYNTWNRANRSSAAYPRVGIKGLLGRSIVGGAIGGLADYGANKAMPYVQKAWHAPPGGMLQLPRPLPEGPAQ